MSQAFRRDGSMRFGMYSTLRPNRISRLNFATRSFWTGSLLLKSDALITFWVLLKRMTSLAKRPSAPYPLDTSVTRTTTRGSSSFQTSFGWVARNSALTVCAPFMTWRPLTVRRSPSAETWTSVPKHESRCWSGRSCPAPPWPLRWCPCSWPCYLYSSECWA